MPLTSLKQIAGGEDLLNRLIAVERKLTLLSVAFGKVERNHDYKQSEAVFNTVNDTVDSSTLLKCSVSGVTGSQDLVIPDNAKSGDSITDGTVTWTLYTLNDE